MDTSETYISMCEKAEEIQKLSRVVEQGDLFAVTHQSNVLAEGIITRVYMVLGQTLNGMIISGNIVVPNRAGIWLPRQDQLQEMVLDKQRYIGDLSDLENEFYKFGNKLIKLAKDNKDSTDTFTMLSIEAESMEQLWLAFFMHKKYHKTWDGTTWLEEN